MKSFACWMFMIANIVTTGGQSTQTTWPTSSLNQTLINSLHIIKDMLTWRLKARPNIPPQYYTKSIPTVLSYMPLQITNVDEVFQTITVSSVVSLTWKDSNIGWDSANYSDIESIEMPATLFWVPSVIIPQATQKTNLLLPTPEKLQARYDGQVTAHVQTLITSLCSFDMTEFPFDSHNCTIVFLDRDFYNITHNNMKLPDISRHFGTSVAWILRNYSCITTRTHSVSQPFYYVMCHVQLSRRGAFFVVNFILPMILTSVMTLMVFWLPADGGEKISFLTSIFTSTFVFLNYMIDMIPRSMERIPHLNVLLFAIDFQVILATAATAFVLRRYKQEQEEKRNFQQPVSRFQTWFWLSCCHVKRKEPCWKNTHPVLLSHRNIVHSEAMLNIHTVSPDRHGRNTEGMIIRKEAGDTWEFECRNDLTNTSMASPMEMDLPESPEDSPTNGHVSENCLRCRSFTHQQLDMVFFVLLSLLSCAIYVYTFML